MERRIELRHQRWKFQESPISSSPPSLFQKFPPNSLPTSVKPPPKEINEHPIYAHENHAGTRFPPRPWWNSPGVVSMSRDKKKEKEREKRKNWSIPCFRGCFQRDQNGSWTWRNGWGETSGGEFMRDNFHGGKWKVGIRQCHERGEGERKRCAINVDVDGELVEFREEKMWNGRIVGKKLREMIFFWSYIFDINSINVILLFIGLMKRYILRNLLNFEWRGRYWNWAESIVF